MSISWKISYFIILAGAFVLLMFAAADYQNLSAGFYLIADMLLVFLLLFGFFIGEYISRPLKKIVKRARELVAGNFEDEINIKSDDELGQLADALNQIAKILKEVRDQKEQVGHTVGVKVNSLVQPFYETLEALEQKVAHRTMDMHKALKFSEKLQMSLVSKEAQLLSVKNKLAKSKKRKSKSILS